MFTVERPGGYIVVLRRVCVVTAAGALVLLNGAAPVASADDTASSGTSREAWYSTADACAPPTDCSLLPPPPAYPADTLHVGVASGKTTAVTYLELDTSKLPDGANVSGGTLNLPVDTAQPDGSLAQDQAKLVACLVREPFPSSQGGFGPPPKADCAQASAPAQYKADSKPAFTVDLAAFAMRWTSGETPRLAILPPAEALTGQQTWHVTFWGNKNTGPGATPITAQLSYTATGTNASPSDTQVPASGGWVDSTGVPTSGFGAPAVAPVPALSAPATAAPAQQAAPQPEAASETYAEPEYRTVGYAYPIAWLMPLLLLIGFLVTGRALTKKLDTPLL